MTSLARTTALSALRSVSRSNCQLPSQTVPATRATTVSAKRTQRRLSRKPHERTTRQYAGARARPLLDQPPGAYHGPMHLSDSYGRVATDLRVSLTDRCNLRCSYCMPEEGLDWLANESVLTDDEVVRLVRVGVERLGITEVRFTGGEPLLRRGLADIVRRTTELTPRPETSLTTNALGLSRTASALAAAGLDRINVSLDTVRDDTFREITRRDRFQDVVEGLAAARAAGLGPIKVNAVLLRGVNDDQAPELLEWCLQHGYDLRFIEQMPLDAQHGWDRQAMVTADEIFDVPRDPLSR